VLRELFLRFETVGYDTVFSNRSTKMETEAPKKNRVELWVEKSCLVLLERGKTMGLSGIIKPSFGTMGLSKWGLFLF
jgi:hypothetical protein